MTLCATFVLAESGGSANCKNAKLPRVTRPVNFLCTTSITVRPVPGCQKTKQKKTITSHLSHTVFRHSIAILFVSVWFFLLLPWIGKTKTRSTWMKTGTSQNFSQQQTPNKQAKHKSRYRSASITHHSSRIRSSSTANLLGRKSHRRREERSQRLHEHQQP